MTHINTDGSFTVPSKVPEINEVTQYWLFSHIYLTWVVQKEEEYKEEEEEFGLLDIIHLPSTLKFIVSKVVCSLNPDIILFSGVQK